MAKFDDEFIEAVGIYFETHDVSATEVAELHNVPRSTMYHWIKEKGWIQNKYRSVAKRAPDLIDRATMAAISDGACEALTMEIMDLDSNIGLYDKGRAGKVAARVMREALTMDELKQDVTDALNNARDIAVNSKRLGDQRTWLKCIKTGAEIIYGKNPDTVIQLSNIANLTEVDMAQMSQDDLLKLASKAMKKE